MLDSILNKIPVISTLLQYGSFIFSNLSFGCGFVAAKFTSQSREVSSKKKKKKKKSYGFHNEHYLSGTNFSITYSYFFPLKYERFIYPPILVNNVGRSYWAHSEPCLEVNIFSYNYSFYSVGPRISHCSLPQKFLLCWVGTIQGRSGEP